jgi:hypothetical protein
VGEEGNIETPPPPLHQVIPLSTTESKKLTQGQLVFHAAADSDPTPHYIYVYMVVIHEGEADQNMAASGISGVVEGNAGKMG